MTAQKLIEDIRARYPNTYTDAQIINWINSATEEVWDNLAFNEVVEINIEAGASTYALPKNCEFHGILNVVVEGREYTARSLPDYLSANSYFKLVENTITIHPNPEKGKMYITYLRKPAKVTIITDALDIRPQTTEVVINAVLSIIAKSNGEVELANNYIADYNAALTSAKEKKPLNGGTFPKIREVKA